jgi:hypothetical protein
MILDMPLRGSAPPLLRIPFPNNVTRLGRPAGEPAGPRFSISQSEAQ